jgi:hypothetical protein
MPPKYHPVFQMQPATISIPVIEETDDGAIESVITLPADIYRAMEVFCYFNPRIKPA